VDNLLEGSFELLVVNARHIKAVPGRKTDVKDAEWIADLLHHGLLKASFIPSAPQRQLRELTRYRVRLTEERAREVNRIQKTLEDTNLKWGDVVSEIMGKASRMILSALAEGETDPALLAAIALGRVRADQQQLEAALTGHVDEHHRFLLREHLTQIEHLEQAIERVTAEIVRRLTPAPPPEDGQSSKPEVGLEASEAQQPVDGQQVPPAAPKVTLSWAQAVILLASIPGISVRAACGILAEIGTTMQQFPTAGQLARLRRRLPGHPRKCWQTPLWKDPQRQSLVATSLDPSRLCRGAPEERLSGGTGSPHCRAAWKKACRDGGGSQHPSDYLSPVE
jgi:transposase